MVLDDLCLLGVALASVDCPWTARYCGEAFLLDRIVVAVVVFTVHLDVSALFLQDFVGVWQVVFAGYECGYRAGCNFGCEAELLGPVLGVAGRFSVLFAHTESSVVF